MANRFGIFYDNKTGKAYTDNTFQTEYIPKTHRNPKTPVHAKMFEQDRERAAAKRKKDSDKQKKEAMKKYVEGGCGHANIFDFIEPNSAIEDWRNRNALLTNEKEQYPYTQNSTDGDDDDDNDVEECDDTKRMQVLSQVASSSIRSDREDHSDYVMSKVASANVHSPSSSSKSSEESIEVLKTVSAEGAVTPADGVDNGIDDADVKCKKRRKTEPEEVKPGFVCSRCGNRRKQCHQYVYGAWLVQEALSLLNEKEANEITKDDINHRMKVSYNDKINFHCFKKTFLYNSDCWYDFPDCLKEGSVAFAHRIINDGQVLYHLQQKRQGGIAAKTMRNTATKIYDYGNLLNDYSDVL